MCSNTFETPHPYPPGLEMYRVIHFPGAEFIRISFANACSTDYGFDYITFYKGQSLGCQLYAAKHPPICAVSCR